MKRQSPSARVRIPGVLAPHHKHLAERCVAGLLLNLGFNTEDAGIKDTPSRVVRAFEEMTRGYAEDPKALLSVVFPARFDELVALADIPFTSMCEHHLLPFVGKAGVAYIPKKNGGVVGLSKLARLVDVFSARLQLQERITQEVAESLWENLHPRSVAVVLEAHHQCMSCRGVKKPGARMVTSVMLGGFQSDAASRAEALKMLGY